MHIARIEYVRCDGDAESKAESADGRG